MIILKIAISEDKNNWKVHVQRFIFSRDVRDIILKHNLQLILMTEKYSPNE